MGEIIKHNFNQKIEEVKDSPRKEFIKSDSPSFLNNKENPSVKFDMNKYLLSHLSSEDLVTFFKQDIDFSDLDNDKDSSKYFNMNKYLLSNVSEEELTPSAKKESYFDKEFVYKYNEIKKLKNGININVRVYHENLDNFKGESIESLINIVHNLSVEDLKVRASYSFALFDSISQKFKKIKNN